MGVRLTRINGPVTWAGAFKWDLICRVSLGIMVVLLVNMTRFIGLNSLSLRRRRLISAVPEVRVFVSLWEQTIWFRRITSNMFV